MKALVGVLSAILLGDVTGNIGQTAYGLSEDPGSANALSGDMCLSNRYSAAAALNSQVFYASAPLGSTSEDKASSTRA